MSEISQGMGRKNAVMGEAHFSVLRMGKVRRLLKVSFFFSRQFYERIIRIYVVFPRLVVGTFVYILPDTFKTLSVTIVEHFPGLFLRDNIANSGKESQLKTL